MNTNFQDVKAFHAKFGVPEAGEPSFLDLHAHEFRAKFMQEELDEFYEAVMCNDMAGAGDALIDLVYVALGTAAMMGLPWQAMWDEVQRANMSKVRATSAGASKRGTALDVIKPDGWVGPQHMQFLRPSADGVYEPSRSIEWPLFNATGA